MEWKRGWPNAAPDGRADTCAAADVDRSGYSVSRNWPRRRPVLPWFGPARRPCERLSEEEFAAAIEGRAGAGRRWWRPGSVDRVTNTETGHGGGPALTRTGAHERGLYGLDEVADGGKSTFRGPLMTEDQTFAASPADPARAGAGRTVPLAAHGRGPTSGRRACWTSGWRPAVALGSRGGSSAMRWRPEGRLVQEALLRLCADRARLAPWRGAGCRPGSGGLSRTWHRPAAERGVAACRGERRRESPRTAASRFAEEMQARARAEALRAALAELPPRQPSGWRCGHLEGLGNRRIARSWT